MQPAMPPVPERPLESMRDYLNDARKVGITYFEASDLFIQICDERHTTPEELKANQVTYWATIADTAFRWRSMIEEEIQQLDTVDREKIDLGRIYLWEFTAATPDAITAAEELNDPGRSYIQQDIYVNMKDRLTYYNRRLLSVIEKYPLLLARDMREHMLDTIGDTVGLADRTEIEVKNVVNGMQNEYAFLQILEAMKKAGVRTYHRTTLEQDHIYGDFSIDDTEAGIIHLDVKSTDGTGKDRPRGESYFIITNKNGEEQIQLFEFFDYRDFFGFMQLNHTQLGKYAIRLEHKLGQISRALIRRRTGD